MRGIRIDDLTVSDEWKAQAKAALVKVRGASEKERAKVINSFSDIWGALKAELAALSKGKCWYCEGREIRSDNAVDHFRPKNAVYGVKDHSGYWWLAFDPANYRYSCTFCNCRRRDLDTGFVGGKQDRFPLLKEDGRAFKEDQNWHDEEPLLLDPTVQADTFLLYFENDGRVVPSVQAPPEAAATRRAATSISLYHLNHTSLKRARKRLYNRVRDLVDNGDVYFSAGPPDERIDHARRDVVGKILELRAEETCFWSAAQHFLSTFEDPSRRPWLDAVLGSE